MSETILLHQANSIGPETMVYVYDPVSNMKGLLVVDTTAPGTAGGGVRMAPDLSAQEVFDLARAMTNKYAIMKFPRGGCKSGIWGDPGMPRDKKRNIMMAYGRAIRPYLESGIAGVATDLGTSNEDVEAIHEGAGIKRPGKRDLFTQDRDGEQLPTHFTGYGVVSAMKAAAQIAGLNFKGARLAIEGFGKVGFGAVRYGSKEGAKIIALSTIHGAIYNEDGLDAPKLLELRKQLGDECIKEYKDAKHIPSSEIYFLPVDILMPGARAYVISKHHAPKVQAKIIVSGANIPITAEAEEMIFKRGILSVPDFISNAGGIIGNWALRVGGDGDQALKSIHDLITKRTTEVLLEAREKRIMPKTVAENMSEQEIIEVRKQAKRLTLEETTKKIKGLLGIS